MILIPSSKLINGLLFNSFFMLVMSGCLLVISPSSRGGKNLSSDLESVNFIINLAKSKIVVSTLLPMLMVLLAQSSEKAAVILAQALKIDAIEIMAISNALKAENNEIKMIWLKLAKQKEEERSKKG